ncbi:hypothetical protein DAI22_02g023866 [Oryza sativa Japonica Group]|nr:hypothetical protein DAI22_02g023866 [Oryza sativa Japonica Group]
MTCTYTVAWINDDRDSVHRCVVTAHFGPYMQINILTEFYSFS